MKNSFLKKLSILLIAGIFFPHKFALSDNLSLGISQIYVTSPYKANKAKLFLLPSINYDSKYFYVRGTSVGYYLCKNPYNQLSILANHKYWGIQSDNSEFKSLNPKAINKRNSSIMSGIKYDYSTSFGVIRALYLRDIFEKNNNATAEISYLYPVCVKRFTVVPGFGVTWASKYQNDQYYGVNQKDSKDQTISYKASDSWSPYLEFYMDYSMSDNLHAYIVAKHCHLSKIITSSPVVDKQDISSAIFSIAYKF